MSQTFLASLIVFTHIFTRGGSQKFQTFSKAGRFMPFRKYPVRGCHKSYARIDPTDA